jgi:antirestriction protein ArdC
MKQSIYEEITGRIITMLEAGTIPWRKPWTTKASMPRNAVSKKAYRGANVFLLHSLSYESPFFATYKQIAQLGGSVRRGEKACPVIFWKQLEVEDKATGETEKIHLLRYFYVFNLAQCQGLKNIPAPVDMPTTSTEAQSIIDNMPQRPDIKYGMAKAFYSPREDCVGMPNRERFDNEAGFFATIYHELTHATGHETRLNRPTVTEHAGFGSNEYSKEELVAELGASFLCAEAGIEHTLDNTAAYISNWLTVLKNDSKLIIQASAQAQRATDFILAKKFGEAATE